MIEILRKEVGPWWFGRIKKEDASLVEEILDPELGWFPKDFVRIIHSPETDAFFNLHKTEEPKEELVDAEVNENQVPVPIAELNSSCEQQQEDANSTMTVDQSNITTIVIESPPAPSTSSAAAAAEAEEAATTTSARINVQLENCDILRRNAVRELLETEVNYVKLLAAICEG